MEQSKIDRINELARLAKTRALTPDEEAERVQLRTDYVAAYRDSLRTQLENTYVQLPDGRKVKLPKKGKPDPS